MEQGLKKGRAAPHWYDEEPDLNIGEAMFIREFWRLDSERSIGGNFVGRIPFSKIEARAEKREFSRSFQEVFLEVVSALDSHYLRYVTDSMKKKASK